MPAPGVAVVAAMKCGICHYVAPPDGTGHTARTCPLRQTLCRRSLQRDHPFAEKGQCGNAKCVHHKVCGVCGLTGHQYGTQTYALDRWVVKDGRLLRKKANRPLDETDFVCVLMTSATVRNLVNNTQSVSAAAAQVGIERRRNVSRLRANTHAEAVGLDESVRLMQSLGSSAAVLQGDNKVAFDALVAARDDGAVAANRRAADAVESDVDGAEGGDGEEGSDDNKVDGDVVSVAGANSTPRSRVKSLRGPPGGRMGLYAAAINKGKSPRSNGKNKAVKGAKADVQPHVPVVVDLESLWPPGTRQPWSSCMPEFNNPDFGSLPPLKVAHLVIEQMCQCPVADADPELAALLIAGAMQSHVRGYSLMSGTLSAAQVADWLCSTMPATMKPALLTTIAVTVDTLVRRAGTRPASSWGPHASSSKGGPSNSASAADTAPSRAIARSGLRGLPGGCALSASQSSAAAPASVSVVRAVPAIDVDNIFAGDAASSAGVALVRGSNMAPMRSDRTGGAATVAPVAAARAGVADVEQMNVVDDEDADEAPVVHARGAAQ